MGRCLPVIGIVFRGKGGCEEKKLGAGRVRLGTGGEACEEGDAQSTKPFHAVTEARRAVSTVPPMTTSF